MKNIVTALAPSFLIGSPFLFQITKTIINSQMGSKFGKIRQGTEE